MEDIEVPFPVARNSVPMPPWATPSSYRSYGSSASPSSARPTLSQSAVVQPATYTQETKLAPEASAAPITIIALRGGAAYLTREYWVQNGQLHCISASGEENLLSLDKVDLTETVRVNQERNVDFLLQSREVVEQ